MAKGDVCPGGNPQPCHHEEASAGGVQPVADGDLDEVKHAQALIQRLPWHTRPHAYHQTVTSNHAGYRDTDPSPNTHPNHHHKPNTHPGRDHNRNRRARPRAYHQTVADIHASHQDRNTTSHADANHHPNLHKHRNRHPNPHRHAHQHRNSHGPLNPHRHAD
jgi:hypothetical protein